MQLGIWRQPYETRGSCSESELSSLIHLFPLTSKRGGKLIAYETITPETILPGFIFGILPGWWLGMSSQLQPSSVLPEVTEHAVGEEKNREWGPLLCETDWSTCLARAGFSGVDFNFGDRHDPRQSGTSAIISTAIKTEQTTVPSLNTVIIKVGVSTFEDDIIRELKSKLDALLSMDVAVCDVLDCQSRDLSQSTCIFLSELQEPFLYRISEAVYYSLRKVISTCHALLWVTSAYSENPASQLVQGFARCIREENKGLRLITASLDTSKGIASLVHKITLIYGSAILDAPENFEQEFVEENDILLINRVIEAVAIDHHVHSKTKVQPPVLQPLGQCSTRPLKLSIAAPGMLDTFEFREDLRASLPLLDDEVEIEIKASGLNFRDVLTALGQLTASNLGGECAGVVTKAGLNTHLRPGDRVVAFVEDSFATAGRCKSSKLCTIPEEVSFAAAAALPTIFCTAHYSMSQWARLQPGETILIHSAAGGFGQAVIQFAKLYGAEIYVTVGSDEKRQFLFDTYNIPKDHMFSSRSESFANGIKRMTKNRGVDVVVNSLAGEALRSSWECVAPFGRFIEVGKKDIYNYGTLPMYQFAKNVTFACVDLVHLLEEKAELVGTLLKEVVDMLRLGKITCPKPLHVYESSRVEEAFRYMQSGKNLGKIVVEFQADDIVPVRNISFVTEG